MARTIRKTQTNDKIAGAGSGPSTDYISPRKVAVFITLFESIKNHLGSDGAAQKAINIKAHNAIPDMRNKKKLSAFHAKLIIDCHTRLLGNNNGR